MGKPFFVLPDAFSTIFLASICFEARWKTVNLYFLFITVMQDNEISCGFATVIYGDNADI